MEDILEAIQRIREYTELIDYASFSQSSLTQDAVARNLGIIGEAANKIDEAYRDATPEIEWRKIIGLRNLLIHEYFGISLPVVWDVVVTKLDALERACQRLMEEFSG